MATIVIAIYFATFFIFTLWRPGCVLAAALTLNATEQWAQANSSFFVAHPAFMNYGFGMLTLWALMIAWIRNGISFRKIPMVSWLSFVMLGLAYVSRYWSIGPMYSRVVFEAYFPYLVTYCVLFPMVFSTSQDIRIGLVFTYFAGAVVLVMVYMGTVVGFRSVEFTEALTDRFGHVFTAGNPLAIGSFGGYMILVGMSLRFAGASKIVQLTRWLILPLGLLVVFKSESRGQLIAAVLSLGAVYVINFGKHRFQQALALCVGFAVVGLVIAVALPNVVVTERWGLNDQIKEFKETRLDVSWVVLKNWLMQSSAINYLFGMGSSSSYALIDGYPHITALEVLCELGLVGFALGTICVTSIFRHARNLLRMTRNNLVDRGDVSAIVGLFIFSFILSFKEGCFLGSATLLGLGALTARFSIIYQEAAKAEWRRERKARIRTAPPARSEPWLVGPAMPVPTE